jgi:hypothetical protein
MPQHHLIGAGDCARRMRPQHKMFRTLGVKKKILRDFAYKQGDRHGGKGLSVQLTKSALSSVAMVRGVSEILDRISF